MIVGTSIGTRTLQHDARQVAARKRRALCHLDRAAAEVGVRGGVLDDRADARDALVSEHRLETGRVHR